ncbi:MAG: glycosyltransferase [Anaerolineae bacterium]
MLDQVNFHGTVAYDVVPTFYQRAALHVLSSRHEGLGMVTLEAAACAIPSVSTAFGLLPDCPEMGICVPVGDDVALSAAIAHLLHDEAQRAALSASALKTVRERYTIQQTVRQFTALYQSLRA